MLLEGKIQLVVYLETIDFSVAYLRELVVSLGSLQEFALCVQYASIACLILQLQLLILQFCNIIFSL